MTAILLILILISLRFNIQSLKGVVEAELVGASWKELYKMLVNVLIIIYAYLTMNQMVINIII
jgi:hypothetical protein